MRSSIVSIRHFHLLGFIFIFSFVLTSLHSEPLAAVNNDVNVAVCGDDAGGASIEITEPIDDSVVNQPTVTFRGTVANTTQIEIKIDGEYAGTVPVGSNQTTFTTDLTFVEGTHTVTLTANDICQQSNASASVVITYQPAAEPSNGEGVPTDVESGGGALIGTDTEGEPTDEPANQEGQMIPLIGPATQAIANLAEATGLTSTIENSPVAVGIARVVLTVMAVTGVVLATTFAPMLIQAVPGVPKAFDLSGHRALMYTAWLIRGISVLLMACAYFL